MNQAEYKATMNGTNVFFISRVFDSAKQQLDRFIANGKGKHPIVVHYKNIHSKWNFGWKYIGTY
jgi:hypothetical protein